MHEILITLCLQKLGQPIGLNVGLSIGVFGSIKGVTNSSE